MGVEYTHIQDPGHKSYLRDKIESTRNEISLGTNERLRILEKLSAAELFERFLHTKFLGQKRFSLEGAESLIPMLDTIVEHAPEFGVREVVFGMAHRGRLNVLSNILGKSLESMFSEFEDSPLHRQHRSARATSSTTRATRTIAATRSGERRPPEPHRQPVAPGSRRPGGRGPRHPRQAGARRETTRVETILPVLVHGDAAFAGQGIVAETLNLSKLCAGTPRAAPLHVIVNNQIGFTTTPATRRARRSTAATSPR